jgi:hypothetical protein
MKSRKKFVLGALIGLSFFILFGCADKSFIHSRHNSDDLSKKQSDTANSRISPVKKFNVIVR